MTAQFPDMITFNDRQYSIVGVNGTGLFDPQDIGIIPVATVSACWRGYVCGYKVMNDRLILDQLNLSLGHAEKSGKGRSFMEGPVINGVVPDISGRQFFGNTYEGLNLDVHFSGGILTGTDFIQELYVHMGFHPAWKYRTVFELLIEDGSVREIRDASAVMDEIRRKMAQFPLQPDIRTSTRQEVQAWIEKCFHLEYDLRK